MRGKGGWWHFFCFPSIGQNKVWQRITKIDQNLVFCEYEVSFLTRVYHIYYCFFFSGVAQGLTTFSVRCLWLNVLVMYCLHVITAYWNHRKTNGGKYLYKFIIKESSTSITTKKGWGKHRLDAYEWFPFRIDLYLCFCFTIAF